MIRQKKHLSDTLAHPRKERILQETLEKELYPFLPAGYFARELKKEDISALQTLQKASGELYQHPLRENSEGELLQSLRFGIWVGVFSADNRLCAYTAVEFQHIREYTLLYFKVTLRRKEHLKGFQPVAFRFRRVVAEKLLACSPFPCIGGYVSVSPANTQSRKAIIQAGFTPLFSVPSLYGASPHGNRELYGYGEVNGLCSLLSLKLSEKTDEIPLC